MSTTSNVVSLRVLVAGTGTVYKISLPITELTVANVRGHMAAAVPYNDQILLLGPPYKVPKDSNLQSEEILKALSMGDTEDQESSNILSSTEQSKRLFLFSKQALSEHAPEPPPCQLKPTDITLPNDAPGPSPLAIDPSSSPPLHQALSAYERQFMLYLAQGRVLADAADLRFQACRTCVQEQAIMARALRAAVSNLSSHYTLSAKTRAEFTSAFQAKTALHASLLQRFEHVLSSLANVPLHPSLVTRARMSGRPMETLLDTVPVERERAWAQQCQNSHQRLMNLFHELESHFTELGTLESREEQARGDQEAEQEIQNLWKKVEGTAREIRDRQAQCLEQLTSYHRQVVNIIMNAIQTENDDEVQAAFTPLREMSNASKAIIPSMTADDNILKELMVEVADAKTRAMKRIKIRLREVSKNQSLIQRVLSSVGVLKDALAQQVENMTHLEHVAELPSAYRDFLSEIRRRRAYGHAVTSTSNAMMERLASMRSDEVKAREKFLRGHGRHLMPAFFEIFVPTLATPPPLFTPQLPGSVELDTLPDVGREDLEASMPYQGISSASTLTAESHQPPMEEGSSVAIDAQQQEGLIVSADEQSAGDAIGDPVSSAAADAQIKTLAYENAILRQAIERMGGKPPTAYVEETAEKEGSSKVDPSQLSALQKELAEAKADAKAARDALQNAASEKKLSDKISHSSFDVGDVGLFMPTGRGSGGKRTYLAFHTNCPHRYLNTDNIRGTPDFVLGRIIYQEELVAGEIGTDANPYGLHVGTKFWVLTVEILNSHT